VISKVIGAPVSCSGTREDDMRQIFNRALPLSEAGYRRFRQPGGTWRNHLCEGERSRPLPAFLRRTFFRALRSELRDAHTLMPTGVPTGGDARSRQQRHRLRDAIVSS